MASAGSTGRAKKSGTPSNWLCRVHLRIQFWMKPLKLDKGIWVTKMVTKVVLLIEEILRARWILNTDKSITYVVSVRNFTKEQKN